MRALGFENLTQSYGIGEVSGVQMEKVSDNTLRLTATRYVHITALSGDCVFEDNYFSMRKGEERVISFRTEIPSEITLETYTLEECGK